MPLDEATDLLAHAQRHHYAVGYFESWDMASLEGVMMRPNDVAAR